MTMLITLARKPLEGTVARNAMKWGCGGINIDASRIGSDKPQISNGQGFSRLLGGRGKGGHITEEPNTTPSGRWPANVLHDGSDTVLVGFPATSPSSALLHAGNTRSRTFGQIISSARTTGYTDSGSAARFFKQVQRQPDGLPSQDTQSGQGEP